MAENKLALLSMEFSVDIFKLCGAIKGNSALTNQLLRSATSIGANIHEANYAHSKADFIAKLQIALKECYETEYWLELFYRTAQINEETAVELKNRCGTLRRVLIASINTTKKSLDTKSI
ncbi:MAG TPA: four helix bundle protein [Oscillospiraceae bacterium]|nr:four helix bundle protein [Oscillospiraceae bacterium]